MNNPNLIELRRQQDQLIQELSQCQSYELRQNILNKLESVKNLIQSTIYSNSFNKQAEYK